MSKILQKKACQDILRSARRVARSYGLFLVRTARDDYLLGWREEALPGLGVKYVYSPIREHLHLSDLRDPPTLETRIQDDLRPEYQPPW